MAEELQQLIDKINRDGVEKATAAAAQIRTDAEKEAAACVKRAEEQAAATVAKAEDEAKAHAQRAEETIRQAARDTLLATEAALMKRFEAYLVRDVNSALSDPATAAGLARDAVKALVAGDAKAEVAANAALADAIRAQFAADAAQSGVTVTTDDSAGSGFTIRIDGGRIEHDFTGKTLASALAARLRPVLAACVTAQ